MLVGGKILNRIGSIAVLLGVVFFMKYAFDNDWITPAMRCLMGGAAGLGLIALAERTRKKGLIIFTQGIVAAGVPLIFFSIYAAYNYYSLLSQTIAFLLLVASTLLSIALALRHKSMFLVIMSVVFGMLVPALLPTGHINTAALHTYVLLLDIGLVGMVVGLKRWRIVASLAAAGTWFWWTAWLNAVSYDQLTHDRPLALALLITGGLLFTLADLLFTRANIRFEKNIERILSTVSALAWSGLLSYIVMPTAEWIQGSYVFSALWYLTLTWLGSRIVSNERAFATQYMALATAMFGLASISNLVSGWVAHGSTNTALLQTFILVMALGLVVTVLSMKRWTIILFVTAFGTWCWWLGWLIHLPSEQLINDRTIALSFLVTFGILFTVVDFLRVRAGLRLAQPLEHALTTASALMWSALLAATVQPTAEWAQGSFVFSAMWYLGVTWLGARMLKTERVFALQYMVLATTMFGAACLSNAVRGWVAGGDTNTVLLHAFIMVLDLCLMATVLGLKRWTPIVWILALGTWCWWLSWLAYVPQSQLIAERTIAIAFIVAFGIMFTVADIVCLRVGLRLDKSLERIITSVSALVWTTLLCLTVDSSQSSIQGALLFASGWFVVVAIAAYRMIKSELAVASQYSTLATVLLGAACFLNMSNEESIRSLACVALVSLWINQRYKLVEPSIAAIVFGVFAAFWTLAIYSVRIDANYALLFNERTFTFAIVIATTWLMGLRLASSSEPNVFSLSRALRFGAYLLLFIGVHEEVLEYFIQVGTYTDELTYLTNHFLGIALAPTATAFVAAALYVLATRRGKSLLQLASMAALLIATITWMFSTFEYYPDASYTPFTNARLLSGIVVIVCLAVAYMSSRNAPQRDASTTSVTPDFWYRPVLAFALLFSTFQLASLEAVWSVVVDIRIADAAEFSTENSALLNNLWNSFHLILSSTWIAYSAILMVVGFLRRVAAIRIAAMVLLGVSILKVFLYDLSFLGQPYRIVSFIALGLILLAASYVYARFRHIIMGKEDQPTASTSDGDSQEGPSTHGDDSIGSASTSDDDSSQATETV